MNLPDTWAVARIGDLLYRVDAKVDPQKSQSNDYFYVGLEHIESDTGRLLREPAEFTEGTDILSIKTVFKKGDILYGKLRPNLNKVHLAKIDGICSTDIWALRTSEFLLSDYAFRYLKSPAINVRASQFATGANLPRLSAEVFDGFPIHFPTLLEQDYIVTILKQAETFEQSRLLTQETLNTLLREQYIALFGNVLRNENKWKTCNLHQVSEIVRGSSPRPQGDPRLYGGKMPRLMVSDLTRDGLWVSATTDSLTDEGAKSSRLMSAQSVVMAVSGAPGLTAILNHDACIHDGFVGLRDLSSELLPEFVAFTLNFMRAINEQKAVGAVYRNLTTDQVKAIVIPVPPLEKQELFREFLLQWRIVQMDILKSKQLLKELTTAITLDAFSGVLTQAWREENIEKIRELTKPRDSFLRERGTKIRLPTDNTILPVAKAELPIQSARQSLFEELGEFQRQVLAAFIEYCQQSDKPLLVEDPDVFARFCDDSLVVERLENFGESLGNRIRRTLSQLAALGLIAKVTLPKHNQETGELDYLKAFRPFRPDEHTRMADLQSIRNSLSPPLNYYFTAQLDYETSERAGAGGMFQVISIEDDDGKDFTYLVDQGKHYASEDALKMDIASALKVGLHQVELEVV